MPKLTTFSSHGFTAVLGNPNYRIAQIRRLGSDVSRTRLEQSGRLCVPASSVSRKLAAGASCFICCFSCRSRSRSEWAYSVFWLEGEPATSRQRFWGALWMIYKGVYLRRIPLYWRSSSDPATAQKAGNKAGNAAVLPAHLPARYWKVTSST